MPPESELRFSVELYSLDAVRQSAEAFGELAEVSVEAPEGSSNILVRFASIREDVADAIADEFCNHALAGTIERRRLAEV